MIRMRSLSTRALGLGITAAVLFWAAACVSRSIPTAQPSPPPSPTSELDILHLPSAFRYEVTLRPPGGATEPDTVIVGQYRNGELAQSTRYGDGVPEELVVTSDHSEGVQRSYTRATGDPNWSRWPGVGLDAVYGLASPFSVLRLYPLADQKTPAEPDQVSGVTVATTKMQVAFSAASIERLLHAAVDAVTDDAETRATLAAQLAPLAVPHTVTYWVGEDNRIYRAAATLLAAGADGRPVPWLEAAWRFWDYDDPGIAVEAPQEYVDVSTLAAADPAGQAEPQLDPATTMRIRTFAQPGVPAEAATVVVYRAGTSEVVEQRASADAQFALPFGAYDVQVKVETAEQWLKGVEVVADSVASQDVLFEFGTLELTVVQDGATPQVDIVIYPAGQRETWVAWRSDNPTSVQLPAGTYDIEVALPDLRGNKTVEGIVVSAGEKTSQVIDISK